MSLISGLYRDRILMQCISYPKAPVRRVRIGHRGPYEAYVRLQRPLRGMCQASEVSTRDMCRKCGFRGPYGACAENVAQIEIDMSRNYSILHLRKTKYSNVARVRTRTTLEINKKILSQSSNLEPNRIIFR